MEKLIQDTVNFLESEKDEYYDVFLSTITTELVIPKTRRAIKNYILPLYKDLRNANFLIRHFNIPIAKKTNNPLLKDKVEDNFVDFFEKEKECLEKIKILLKTKSDDCPNVSFSGILLTAISNLHLTNQNKLLTIIKTGASLKNGSFNAYIPEDKLTPTHYEIIENINTGLEKVLVKK